METSSRRFRHDRVYATVVVAVAILAVCTASKGDDSFYHSLTTTHSLTRLENYIAVQIPPENADLGIADLLTKYPCLASDELDCL